MVGNVCFVPKYTSEHGTSLQCQQRCRWTPLRIDLLKKLNNITKISTRHLQQVNTYENEKENVNQRSVHLGIQRQRVTYLSSRCIDAAFITETYPAKCSPSQIAPPLPHASKALCHAYLPTAPLLVVINLNKRHLKRFPVSIRHRRRQSSPPLCQSTMLHLQLLISGGGVR